MQDKNNVVNIFSTPVIVILKLWELIHQHDTISNRKMKQKHLLWALLYMRQYPSFQAITALVKLESDRRRPDEKTLHKWIWTTIDAIESLHTLVILWKNRKINDKDNDCLAFVDYVDCSFQQIKIPHK